MVLISLCLLSFLLSLTTVALIKQRFSQLLLDIPNARSSHTQPTPRGGGLGFILAFAIISAIALLLSFNQPTFLLGLTQQQWLGIWLVLTPLTIVGLIDDRQGVKARIRYLVQLISGAIAVSVFGSFPQPWLTPWGNLGVILALTLTLIGFTAFINFYNFMDGLDGLVAGVSATQMAFLAIYLDQPFLWLLVAALIGFLWWNWSPATIFMGDAGSTILGSAIALSLLIPDVPTTQAWSAVAITLPLVGDAIYTLVRRLLRRENIFQAHRSHLYQRLQKQGWSHQQVALSYIIITAISGICISFLGLFGAGITLLLVASAIAIGETILIRQTSYSN
ncbi:glycosyltransferase family 4 protein [Euhalothece natronophila Z-M001]|uniref:Glycosyltransferase family 4 protein n=1 Tax=Euhalothece natronophila Z-M001 TaxID=522448 RepID=A0A5B8NKH4_9CHRO|nr:glycosyltransferase family 4 protein [Euhalothece natronophila]QDZ39377.1 glycosyltransferase family 4 protein [Euhalothece natronophila Z-M001]